MLMNELMKNIRNHRTIREFKNENLSYELVKDILETVNRTASSMGLQQSSIIRVTDEKKKKAIADVCGQEYVARAPELWIFIVDIYRNYQILQEKGCSSDVGKDIDLFFQGFTDAVLMAQNTTNIVESLGMGAVYLGSILNDSKKIIEILDMPKLTFPALGIGFGKINEEPQLKPRMSTDFRVYENSYKKFDSYLDTLSDYDQEMTTYYDLRDKNRRSDTFTDQVVKKVQISRPNRKALMKIAKDNGFNIEL